MPLMPRTNLPHPEERPEGVRLEGRRASLQKVAAPLAIYIHWPFCRSKCPYCDFNSHVREKIDPARWTRALLADLDRQAALAPDRAVASIFFGGGTPSLMTPETVAALIERVAALWPVAPDLEVTLEANPNSAEAERFAGFAAAGVNRLSLGVQSLDPARCAFSGAAPRPRRGDRGDRASPAPAFPRISFDLIYARPGQSLAAWRRGARRGAELGRRASLALSADDRARHRLCRPRGARRSASRTRRPRPRCSRRRRSASPAPGLPAYEISNHARPGAECRHNLAYWRYEDYLGIGPGAHGRVTQGGGKIATRQRRTPEAWLAAVEKSGTAIDEMAPIGRDEAVEEMVMMGLRLVEGVARDRLETLAGRTVEELFAGALPRLVDGGFLTLDADGLAATAAGRQRLNAVLGALLSC